MTSLRDLAEKLKLSITTVSRALDGYPDVAPATRARVEAMARALNYRPNPAARSLRRQRAEAVGVVVPAEPGRIGPLLFMEILASAHAHLAENGLDLLIVPAARPADELGTIERLINGRRADAVLLLRTRRNDPRVKLLEDCDVPFVTHGRTEHAKPHAYVDGDGEAGFFAATEHLISLGHRRIAHICAPQVLMFAHLRRQGWWRALSAHGLEDPALLIEAEPTEEAGQAAARTALAMDASQRPTALLCATDTMAMGALRAIKDAGLVPGRDISIVGHDNLPIGAFTDPPLSTMALADVEIGKTIAELLLARIGGAPAERLQKIIPVQQIPRATHGPPQGANGSDAASNIGTGKKQPTKA